MVTPQSDDQKKLQREFFEKSLEAAEGERQRIAEAREKHQAEREGFESKGGELIKEIDAEAAKQRSQGIAWRKKKIAQEEMVKADRAKKSALEAEIKAQLDAKKEADDARKEYTDSLHAASLEKIRKEKKELETEQQRKQDIEHAERAMREKKSGLESEERRKKHELEHELLQKKDTMQREHEKEVATIHSESIQKKLQAEQELRMSVTRANSSPSGQVDKSRAEMLGLQKIQQIERDADHRRADCESKFLVNKRMLEQETTKRKTDLERETRNGIHSAEQELIEKKRMINAEADKKRRSA